jgi:hydrogenase/urease accessory protein HupE
LIRNFGVFGGLGGQPVVPNQRVRAAGLPFVFSGFRGQRIWLLAVAAMLWSASAGAHEIGKSQVLVAIRAADFDVDVVVEPDALVSKLEAFGGRPVSRDLSKAGRDRRIRELADVFLEQTEIRFDGRSVRPRFEYVPASAFNDLAQAPSRVRLSGPLPAGAGEFDFRYGLALGTYALNARIGDGPLQTQWIVGGGRSEPFSLSSPPPASGRVEVARQYLTLGFTHIVPHGLDHILFVLGIFLLTSRWRSVVAQVSTFTIAHSITLALTMYGVVSLPAKVVEPMIALSIAYVAIENLIVRELKPWRLALVFSFGLLHGMGFAGVLRDLGLPRPQFLTALVSFNLGVEAGQLTVIAAACLAIAAVGSVRLQADRRSARPGVRLHIDHENAAYRRFIVQPASFLIAAVGLFWTIQRALS